MTKKPLQKDEEHNKQKNPATDILIQQTQGGTAEVLRENHIPSESFDRH